jgi:DNA-binding CsgD family transcriptional regulator
MSTHLSALLAIIQIIATSPTLKDLTEFLGNRSCPSGEVSRTYFAKILNNNLLQVESSYGFKENECWSGKIFPCEISRPSGRAVIENQIIFEENSESYYEKYPSLKDEPIAHIWSSQVTIPINSEYVVRFDRYSKFQVEDQLYYQNLQLLLRIYFSRIGKVALGIGDLSEKPLTARQSEILIQMKTGMTNDEIATAIGYSSSLVKQESMLIFSKLGISGRRDLGIS